MKKISIMTLSVLAVFGLISSAHAQTQVHRKAPVHKKAAAQPAQEAAPAAAPAPAPAPKRVWQRPYGMAGCGLGSAVFGRGGGQISAATTNSTSGSQTFGITSGTSNCVDSPDTEVASRMDSFIMANKLALATDIARGNGEALKTLAVIMNCNGSALGDSLQSNFREIYPRSDVYPNEVTDSIITVIINDQSLLASCKNIAG